MPSSEFIKYIGIIIALLVLIILSYVFASGGMENMSKTLCQTSARVRNFWYHSPLINFPIFNIGASTFSHLSGWAPPLFCSPSKKILDLTKSNRTEILDKLAKEILDCYAKYGGDSFDILMDNANNPQLCSIMHLKLGDNKINMSDLVTFLSTYNVTSINARDCRICTNEAGEYCPSGFTCMEDGSVCYQAIKDCNIEKFPGIKFCPCPKDFSCSGGTKCVKDSVEIDAPVCYNYTSPYSCRINLTYGDLMRALRIVYVSSNVYGVSTCNMEMKSISCPDGRTYQYHDPIFCGCKEPYSDEGYCLNLTKLKEDGKITDNNDLCKLVQRNLSLDSLCNTYKNDVYEFNCASSISTLMCDDSYGCVEPKLGYSLPIYGFIRDDYTRTLYNFTDDILTGEIDLFLFFSDHFIRSLLESGNAKLSDPSFLSSLTYAGRTTYGFTNAFIRYYHSPSVSSYFPMSTTQLTQFQADATTFGFLKTTESYSGNWKKFLRDKSSYFGGIANPPMKYVALTALSGSFTAASTRVPI
ncbi:MAG: hypothetical protein QXP04_00455, partial [Candidatus Nanoarchaeia archaeon]|nr:hypothetical protein [Candidatus Jingweiarchaeum tengchongense]